LVRIGRPPSRQQPQACFSRYQQQIPVTRAINVRSGDKV
jgi:hypothetical protein